MVILENVISVPYGTCGSAYYRILQSPVHRPWQFQSCRFRPALFISSIGGSDKPETTVFVQLGSVLEPPWGIKVCKNSHSANGPDAWKLAPVLYDSLFAGQ